MAAFLLPIGQIPPPPNFAEIFTGLGRGRQRNTSRNWSPPGGTAAPSGGFAGAHTHPASGRSPVHVHPCRAHPPILARRAWRGEVRVVPGRRARRAKPQARAKAQSPGLSGEKGGAPFGRFGGARGGVWRRGAPFGWFRRGAGFCGARRAGRRLTGRSPPSGGLRAAHTFPARVGFSFAPGVHARETRHAHIRKFLLRKGFFVKFELFFARNLGASVGLLFRRFRGIYVSRRGAKPKGRRREAQNANRERRNFP